MLLYSRNLALLSNFTRSQNDRKRFNIILINLMGTREFYNVQIWFILNIHVNIFNFNFREVLNRLTIYQYRINCSRRDLSWRGFITITSSKFNTFPKDRAARIVICSQQIIWCIQRSGMRAYADALCNRTEPKTHRPPITKFGRIGTFT